jgi:hypothetical protein
LARGGYGFVHLLFAHYFGNDKKQEIRRDCPQKFATEQFEEMEVFHPSKHSEQCSPSPPNALDSYDYAVENVTYAHIIPQD